MVSPKYKFLENMRKMDRLSNEQIDNTLSKGYITEQEAITLKRL